MFRLLKNLRPKDVALWLVAVALIAAQVWLELKMPDYMATITKLVQTEGSEMGDILSNGLKMVLCAFGSLISAIGVGYIISTVSATFSMRVRKKLFDKVEELSLNEVRKFSTSSLITRSTNDITQIQMLVSMGGQMLVRAPMTAAWAIVKISNKSWQWSTATAIVVVFLLSMAAILMSIVVPRFKLVQKLTDKINNVTRENLTGIRAVRAFNAEKYQEKKFAKVNDKLTGVQIFNQRMLALMSPVMYLSMEGLALAIYIIGASLIDGAAGMNDKIVLFGDMIVFSSYALQVVISFLMLALIFTMIPRAQVSAGRINEVLMAPISLKNGSFKGDTAEVGTVEFRNVSFKYPDAEDYLLKDISFKANKGETVAFIGSTGSGKTTLINLVPRFYDVTDGEVFVDGIDVREYKQSALRNKIGYVSQKAIMFNGTVTSNVAYGDNGRGKISEKKVREAVKVAQAKNFVEKMDKAYDGHIAQGGTNISGGQKQRLAIARAVARDPEIFIFDDSFSALDYKTDAALRKALNEYTSEATHLIVAQRIGTIMHADKILVLDEGKCVGQGTHKELMKNCEVYRQIALSQLTKEELDV